MTNLQRKCLETYQKCLSTVREKYPHKRIPSVEMQFSNRMTKTGGYYQLNRTNPGQCLIKISNVLLEKNGMAFVNEVVPHEAAHQFVHNLFGHDVKPHGKEWQFIMLLLNQKPKVTHTFKTVDNDKLYIVEGKKIKVGVIRHNRIQRGTHSYRVKIDGKFHAIKKENWVQ